MRTDPWRVLSAAPAGVFDGIGDFSASLTDALRAHRATDLIVRRHSWRELDDVDARQTGGVIVQYFPQAFLRGDLRPLLTWLGRARAAGAPVVLVVHEYWPPLDGSLRRVAVRVLFKRMLRACIRRSTAVVVTQPNAVADVAPLAGRTPIAVIPAGSNIPSVATDEPEQRREIVLFGQPAALEAGAVRALAAWIASDDSAPALRWIARSASELDAFWQASIRAPTRRVTLSGGLPARDVSALLGRAMIGAAPYTNGASTRRTTFCAMLQHGLPVVACDGVTTSDELRQSGACVWSPEGDAAAFVSAVRALAADPARQHQLGAQARAFFDARLSWPRLADSYARLLSAPSEDAA